jgi:hypothetical protein
MRHAQLLFGLLILAISPSCNSTLPTESEVATLIQEAVDQRKVLFMLEPTTFDWDRVFFFPPYSRPAVIHDRLGYAWPGAEHTRVASLDTHTLIVFTKAGRVVHALDYPRWRGDFSRLVEESGYARDDAVFSVVPEGEAEWPYISFMPRLSWLTGQ